MKFDGKVFVLAGTAYKIKSCKESVGGSLHIKTYCGRRFVSTEDELRARVFWGATLGGLKL